MLACNRTYDPVIPHTENIYPVEEGKYRIYHVIDTTYQSTNETGIDAQVYYLRERNVGTEIDLLGREVNKLWREVSNDSIDTLGSPVYEFEFEEQWTQYKDDSFAELIEGTKRTRVLKFPVLEGGEWNANLLNGDGAQNYQYVNLDTTVEINGRTFENCVKVLEIPYYQSEFPGFLFTVENAWSIYAPDVGLVEKYYKYYYWSTDVEGVFDPSDVDPESRVLHLTLIDHN